MRRPAAVAFAMLLSAAAPLSAAAETAAVTAPPADLPAGTPEDAQNEFNAGQTDLSRSLATLKEKIDQAQRAADAASSTDIEAARKQAHDQINSMREVLQKFGPDSPLTNSINKLQSWISANQSRIAQSDDLTSEQKKYLLDRWDQYAAGMDDARRQYGDLARSLKTKLDKLASDDKFVGEKLMLKLGGDALNAIRNMLVEMKASVDAVDRESRSIAMPRTPSS